MNAAGIAYDLYAFIVFMAALTVTVVMLVVLSSGPPREEWGGDLSPSSTPLPPPVPPMPGEYPHVRILDPEPYDWSREGDGR